jgi:hypothetical protein
MKSRVRGRTGFANRSFALRRCLVEILKRRDRLTAAELAGIAYGRRLIVRLGHHRHSCTAGRDAARFAAWSPKARSK